MFLQIHVYLFWCLVHVGRAGAVTPMCLFCVSCIRVVFFVLCFMYSYVVYHVIMYHVSFLVHAGGAGAVADVCLICVYSCIFFVSCIVYLCNFFGACRGRCS